MRRHAPPRRHPSRALGLTLDGLFAMPAGGAKIPADAMPIAWIVAQRGITRRQLAADAGLSPQTISNMGAGHGRDLFSVIAVARAGGVSLDSLAERLSTPPERSQPPRCLAHIPPQLRTMHRPRSRRRVAAG